jgi:hypothetical protein
MKKTMKKVKTNRVFGMKKPFKKKEEKEKEKTKHEKKER